MDVRELILLMVLVPGGYYLRYLGLYLYFFFLYMYPCCCYTLPSRKMTYHLPCSVAFGRLMLVLFDFWNLYVVCCFVPIECCFLCTPAWTFVYSDEFSIQYFLV